MGRLNASDTDPHLPSPQAAYTIVPTTTIVNCPVVPFGSTATRRLYGQSASLTQGTQAADGEAEGAWTVFQPIFSLVSFLLRRVVSNRHCECHARS